MAKIYSDQVKTRARQLHSQGYSLRQICDAIEKETQIRVGSPNTINHWIRRPHETNSKSIKINEKEFTEPVVSENVLAEQSNLPTPAPEQNVQKNPEIGGTEDMSIAASEFEKRFDNVEKALSALLMDKTQSEIEKQKREEELRLAKVVEGVVAPVIAEMYSTLNKFVKDTSEKITSVQQLVTKIPPPEVEHKPTIMHIFSEECRDGSCLASMSENDKLKLRTVLTTPTAKKRFEALGIKMGMTDEQIASWMTKLGEKLNLDKAAEELEVNHQNTEIANVTPIKK